jgi:hypothetical protein
MVSENKIGIGIKVFVINCFDMKEKLFKKDQRILCVGIKTFYIWMGVYQVWRGTLLHE